MSVDLSPGQISASTFSDDALVSFIRFGSGLLETTY